eukprot:3940712-Prymnesium_polylepis.1
MARDGSGWLGVARDGSVLLGMARSGSAGMAQDALEMARNVNVTVRDICNRWDTFRNRLPHLPQRKRLGMRNIHGTPW